MNKEQDKVIKDISISDKNYWDKLRFAVQYFFSSPVLMLSFLLAIKISFQLLILNSGFRWLSADDFCRTVISYKWMQEPKIYSGVWLSPHFWLVGSFMHIFKDLFTAAVTVNFIFSFFTLIYFYRITNLCFSKLTAFYSSLIFCVFPFQVWLSVSGLPESVFFFWIIAGIYYFIKWKQSQLRKNNSELISSGNYSFLILSSVCIALSNCFRYEGWLFSVVLLFLSFERLYSEKKLSKALITEILISLISFTTIIWWLLLNKSDHGDAFYFAKETTKIFSDLNGAGAIQRFIQYPTFIFYIAPFTTVLGLKKLYDSRKNKNPFVIYFVYFNLLELALLVFQAAMGTGGTNMISRYIVINALMFVPFGVEQLMDIKKVFTIVLLPAIIITYVIWTFNFPQPYRQDTFEVGNLLKNEISKKNITDKGKIYFEEVEGYYDIFGVQVLSNAPDKFILGNLDTLIKKDINSSPVAKDKMKPASLKNSDDSPEFNVLDLQNYLKNNNIQMAIVRSDAYEERLKRLSLKHEDLGDYKLFYLNERASYLNDSAASVFKNKLLSSKNSPDIINFNKTFALKSAELDNTDFGLNPQTVTINWGAMDKSIIDSLEYEKLGFDRYSSVVNIKSVYTDSVVYTVTSRIFSDRNVEDLIDYNNVKNIIVLKPFAMLAYSSKNRLQPFESGVYKIELKLYDSKQKKYLELFKGDSLYKPDIAEIGDTTKLKGIDSLSIKIKKLSVEKGLKPETQYPMGLIIAMFPETNYDLLVKRSTSEIYKVMSRNGMKVFFWQRYQGDHFLNWVFNYF